MSSEDMDMMAMFMGQGAQSEEGKKAQLDKEEDFSKRLNSFMQELKELSKKHEIYFEANGSFDGEYIELVDGKTNELAYETVIDYDYDNEEYKIKRV